MHFRQTFIDLHLSKAATEISLSLKALCHDIRHNCISYKDIEDMNPLSLSHPEGVMDFANRAVVLPTDVCLLASCIIYIYCLIEL